MSRKTSRVSGMYVLQRSSRLRFLQMPDDDQFVLRFLGIRASMIWSIRSAV